MMNNWKAILSACCISGCLFLLLIPIGVYYFFSKYLNNDSSYMPNAIVSPEVAKNKAVMANIVLASDIESDFSSLDNFATTVNELSPDAVFILGDITSLGVEEDFIKTKEVLSTLNSEVYYIPGDRDLWKSRGVGNFKQVLGSNYSVVGVKGLNFLLIDNSNEYEGIEDSQLEFIKTNLGNTDYVLFHNPIYFNKSILGVLGKGMGQYSTDVNRQRIMLLELIRKSNTVKATFAGDQHYFSITADDEKDNLTHVVLGSLNVERNLDVPNFVLMKVYEDKTMSVEKVHLPFIQ